MKHWPRQFSLLTFALVVGVGLSSVAQTQAPALAVSVLMQSPADTQTDLQVICLFRSAPENVLHGSLVEANTKLHGLLDAIRKRGLFGGELGETLLLTPPEGSLNAKRLLIFGLGDSATFTPERMYLVGKVALREASRLGVAHLFFAPTILDGGVTRYGTGEVAEQVVRGMRDALATEAALKAQGAAGSVAVVDVHYLAGPKFAKETQSAIDRALATSSSATK